MEDVLITDNKYFSIDQDKIFGTTLATNINWKVPKDQVPDKLIKKWHKYID